MIREERYIIEYNMHGKGDKYLQYLLICLGESENPEYIKEIRRQPNCRVHEITDLEEEEIDEILECVDG